MTFLLDVNVLIALLDSRHVAHLPAHRWFDKTHRSSWASCPITQSGFIRIVSGPGYGERRRSVESVALALRDLTAEPGHVFWPDDLPLVGSDWIDMAAITSHGQITDSYLLALAASKGGKLATFDRRLSTRAVRNGSEALHIIPAT